jgi:hypothetical protein
MYRPHVYVLLTGGAEDRVHAEDALAWLVEKHYAVDARAAWLRAEEHTFQFLRECWVFHHTRCT